MGVGRIVHHVIASNEYIAGNKESCAQGFGPTPNSHRPLTDDTTDDMTIVGNDLVEIFALRFESSNWNW
jgi:hypothetical protein